MQGRQLWTWIVVSSSVVVPLAVVLFSLRYQSGWWPVAAFAGGVAAAVALVELSARIDSAESAERETREPGRVESLRRTS